MTPVEGAVVVSEVTALPPATQLVASVLSGGFCQEERRGLFLVFSCGGYSSSFMSPLLLIVIKDGGSPRMKREKEKLSGEVALIRLASIRFPRQRCHENAFLLCAGLRLLGYQSAIKVTGVYCCFKGKPIHHSWVRWKQYLIETDPGQLARRGKYPNDPMTREVIGVIDDQRIIERYEIPRAGFPDEHFSTKVYKEAIKLGDALKSLPKATATRHSSRSLPATPQQSYCGSSLVPTDGRRKLFPPKGITSRGGGCLCGHGATLRRWS